MTCKSPIEFVSQYMAALLPFCGSSLWLMGLAPRASQILGTALHCLRPCHDVLRRGTRTPVECVRRISCTRSGKPLLFRSSRVHLVSVGHHTPAVFFVVLHYALQSTVVSFHSTRFPSVASCCIAWSRLLSVWTGGGHCVGGRQECASLALLQRCPSGIIAPSGVLGLVLLVVQLWCSGILLRFAAEPVEVLLARHPFGVEQACSARFFAVSILVPCSSSCWHEC